MIPFALFVGAVFALLIVYSWLLYQDRVREEHQRWELMHPSQRDDFADARRFWQLYEQAEWHAEREGR